MFQGMRRCAEAVVKQQPRQEQKQQRCGGNLQYRVQDKDKMKDYVDKCKQKIDYLFYIANNGTIIEFNKKYRSYLENIVDKNKEK